MLIRNWSNYKSVAACTVLNYVVFFNLIRKQSMKYLQHKNTSINIYGQTWNLFEKYHTKLFEEMSNSLRERREVESKLA